MPMKSSDEPQNALLAWRERMGLSQRAAAAELDMTLTAYQEHERGASFATGKPRRIKKSILLAAAAVEHGIPPIS